MQAWQELEITSNSRAVETRHNQAGSRVARKFRVTMRDALGARTASWRFRFVAAVALSCVACGQPPPRVDPGPSERDVWGLRSGDIEQCAQAMARDLIREPLLQRTEPPSRIGIAGVENQTNEPFIGGSAEMVATRIQTLVFRSLRGQSSPGTTAKFIMLRGPVLEAIAAQRVAKRSGETTYTQLKDQHGVDYILSGVYQSLDKFAAGKRVVDMYLTFSLTDAESGEIVWTNDYPVKTVTPR